MTVLVETCFGDISWAESPPTEDAFDTSKAAHVRPMRLTWFLVWRWPALHLVGPASTKESVAG